jgi:predicted nucleic acid-binding protein
VILIDSNIIMYAAGAEHPHKQPSVRMLERVASGDVDAAIDAEVLQEILHRYRAIKRWTDGRRVYDLARQLFPVVIPITSDILDRARRLMDDHAQLMARDALHAAVVIGEELEAICSYDRDFDRVSGLRRVEPDA